jgi:hypothetical protein
MRRHLIFKTRAEVADCHSAVPGSCNTARAMAVSSVSRNVAGAESTECCQNLKQMVWTSNRAGVMAT